MLYFALIALLILFLPVLLEPAMQLFYVLLQATGALFIAAVSLSVPILILYTFTRIVAAL